MRESERGEESKKEMGKRKGKGKSERKGKGKGKSERKGKAKAKSERKGNGNGNGKGTCRECDAYEWTSEELVADADMNSGSGAT